MTQAQERALVVDEAARAKVAAERAEARVRAALRAMLAVDPRVTAATLRWELRDEDGGGAWLVARVAVTIGGVSMKDDPIAAKRMIGFVPDSHELYDRLTGMEYLNFMADVYGVGAQERKAHIEKYLALFELENAAGEQIKSYSRGMKQKLTIIGALVHQPPVWVLDEPMVGLDPRAAHILKEEMRKHCEKGNTVFFSTHVLEVAEKLCDEIAIIDKGRLVAQGTLEALRSGEKGASLEQLFLELTESEEKQA